VTGEIITDQNPPIYLPTGYVISEKGLSLIQQLNNPQIVVCPFTKKEINLKDTRKVYFS